MAGWLAKLRLRRRPPVAIPVEPTLGRGGRGSTGAAATSPGLDGVADGGAAGGGDRLGPWSTRGRTGDERRGLHAFGRAATLIAIGELCVIILLVDTLRVLMPLKETEIRVATVSRTDDVAVWIGEVPLESERAKEIIQRLAVGYVRQRHEVIPDWAEMDKRWGTECMARATPSDSLYDDDMCGYVSLRSSPPVYDAFVESIRDTAAQWISSGLRRSIDFYMDPIWRGGDQIEIRFWAADSQRGREIARRHWTVNLWFSFNGAGAQTKPARFLNPHDFKVVKYSAAEGEVGGKR